MSWPWYAEGLTNTGKYAEASRYFVTLVVTDRLVLEIEDDGTGMELPMTRDAGLGLINIRDRAEKLGGTFELHHGRWWTRLIWAVPL